MLQMIVLISKTLYKLLNILLQVIDPLFLARGQVLPLSLSVAKLLVELADRGISLLKILATL